MTECAFLQSAEAESQILEKNSAYGRILKPKPNVEFLKNHYPSADLILPEYKE